MQLEDKKMNDLQKEVQALKAKVAELESRISAEPVAKWQPKGGEWYIGLGGGVTKLKSSRESKKFGLERDTQAQAERAAVEMRKFNRLLALRDELCGDDVVDWNTKTEKFIVYFSHHKGRWLFSRYEDRQDVAVHFVCLESAKKACDMLNSGEVEL